MNNNNDLREYMNLFEKKLEVLTLMKLPYGTGDLSPVLSKDNVEYHYNVLSKGYVDRYNNGEGDPNFNYGGAMLHLSLIHISEPTRRLIISYAVFCL